jgi:hypothetical protein
MLTKTFSTGSSIDTPYGLVLVSQTVHSHLEQILSGTGTVNFVGEMWVNDDPNISQTTQVGEETYKVDNVLVAKAENGTASYGIGGSSGVMHPLTVKEEYLSNAMQRVFIGNTIDLNIKHYLRVNSGTLNANITVSGKWVFKKVKITKNAYLEKLAQRAYA